MKKAKKAKKAYEKIVEKVIQDLEAGVPPWEKGWVPTSGLPVNYKTGARYRGMNIFVLLMTGLPGEWATFLQWKDLGYCVKKGEAGTTCFKFGTARKKEREPGQTEDEEGVYNYVKAFTVFNITQTTATAPPAQVVERPDFQAFIRILPVPVYRTGDSAYYNPADDLIVLPKTFVSEEEAFRTLVHEAIHSTGHKNRLDRLAERDQKARAFEELVAEMGAAFVCQAYGLEYVTDHSAYIGAWLKRIKSQPNALWKAASKAWEAAEYLSRDMGLGFFAQESNGSLESEEVA